MATLFFCQPVPGRHSQSLYQSTVRARLFCTEVVDPVGVLTQSAQLACRVFRVDLINQIFSEDFLGLDFNVPGLAGDAAQRLVQHDARIWQRRTLSCVGGQRERCDVRRLPNADGPLGQEMYTAF